MDTNAKTQQTNIFAKGMNTDVSDALMENNQYRLANNMRYVTDDEENTGEMHVIEGATKVLDNIEGTVIGMISIRNYGVIITKDEDKSWSVWRYNTEDGTLVRNAHISNHPLSENNKLSLVTKYEDEKNIKVYIADGESPIAVVNIMNETEIRDFNQITSYPNVVLAPPAFEGLIDGVLKEGVVLYSYLLYNTWGTATDASIPTKLIPLHNKDTKLLNTLNFKGVEQGKTSNKGVHIIINSIPLGFEKIRIFRITYVEAGQPPLVELILDTDLKGSQYDLYDTGYEALLIYSVEEYNGISGIHIIPKVIESKDEYMFAAAIKTEQTEFDRLFDPTKFQAPQKDENGNLVDVFDLDTPYTTDWTGESGEEYISWRFTTYDLIGDENGVNEECIKLPEGEKINDTSYYSANGYDNPKRVYDYTSLRRDELYRFGIIVYNDKGGHSSVFWIADIRTPSAYSDTYKTFYIDADGIMRVRSLGIVFNINSAEIQQALEGSGFNAVGYEIVRCNRTEKDIATIAQGVLSRPGRKVTDTEKGPLSPLGWVTTANYYSDARSSDHQGDANKMTYGNNLEWVDIANVQSNDSIFQFISPEMAYSSEQFKYLIEQDLFYLRTLRYLYGQRFQDIQNIPSNEFSIQSRWYDFDDEENKTVTYNVQAYKENGTNLFTFGQIYPGNETTHVTYTDYFNEYTDTTTIYEPVGLQTYCKYVKYDVTNFSDNTIARYDSEYNTPYRHQYIKLYNSTDTVHLAKAGGDSVQLQNVLNIEVVSANYCDALNWDDLADATEDKYILKYPDKLVNIGNDSFVNWVCTAYYNIPVVDPGGAQLCIERVVLNNSAINEYGAVIGPGGRTGLIQIKIDNETETNLYPFLNRTVWDINASTLETKLDSMLGTYLCNLRKNAVPYGGDSDEARKLSTYYSYGYYVPATNYHGEYTTTGTEVYAGDCFVLPFEYVSMHKYYHPVVKRPRNACMVYVIPVETNINLAYTYGYEFSKRNAKLGFATNLQDQPNNVNGIFIQDEPLYAYNTAYSSSNKLLLHGAYQDDKSTIYNEDYRCYYSNPKNNNESIDNWTIYQPANFLDVDTRRGAITGLRTFHNNLVFWQKDATGVFSVNERTTITDESNMPLLLGTGGVLSRYDYINTSNGMKANEFADAQSDSTLYWWDHNKADICAYAGGLEMVVLSKVKSVANFLNKYSKLGDADELNQYGLLKNPALMFDKKYNEMIASVTKGSDREAGSLVYSEQTQQFVGLYGINPEYSLLFADTLYLHTNRNDDLYEWNKALNNVSIGIDNDKLLPYLKYVVNDNLLTNKVFDNVSFGARVYGGGSMENGERNKDALKHLTFRFRTPLKQESSINGKNMENVEYDFRFAVPRHNEAEYGDRMRGKTMQCELWSDTNDLDLSIQYIMTKYRISWS